MPLSLSAICKTTFPRFKTLTALGWGGMCAPSRHFEKLPGAATTNTPSCLLMSLTVKPNWFVAGGHRAESAASGATPQSEATLSRCS